MDIEEGALVRVKGKHGIFTVKDIIEDESGILGYRVTDNNLLGHSYRVDVVSPKKRKRKSRG